ncbi:PDZ and LIM domain protein 5-like [Prinia subflava]|uniref:PDZ and LIM domain protein 5-like n=1 Tax=Prinia subflava TaxID=208062 RepID=UPI002FE39034
MSYPAEPTQVVKPVHIASAVAPKVTAMASVAFNKTARPFGAVTSSKVTSIPSPSSAFMPGQALAGSHCAVLGVHAKPNAELWPPVLGTPKPAVPVPRQHGAAPSASATVISQDAAEGPQRGGRENQGENKQENGRIPGNNNPERPPRKHIVDTYTEFYHTPTHSDASKKWLIEDTEDWHPCTGTTQSCSFHILTQITSTDHKVHSSRPDLKDRPLEDPDWELFTDGSSFVKNGKRMTGYAVTTQDKVIEAKALPADVSSQKAELIALTRALDLSEGMKSHQSTIIAQIPGEEHPSIHKLQFPFTHGKPEIDTSQYQRKIFSADRSRL